MKGPPHTHTTLSRLYTIQKSPPENESVVQSAAQENTFNYDKGVLAEILEPIMGKGLIPADLVTWKPRRKAIAPAFHKAYIEASIRMFAECANQTVTKFAALTEAGKVRLLLFREEEGIFVSCETTSQRYSL